MGSANKAAGVMFGYAAVLVGTGVVAYSLAPEVPEVAIAYAVPAMLLRCLEVPAVGDGRYDSLRLLMYGTAPMPPHAIRALGKVLPSTFLVNLYGLTEGGAAVCSLSPENC